MPLPKHAPDLKLYTEEDYYATPEGSHIELIDGMFHNMSSPNRAHQEIVVQLTRLIANHIDAHNGTCKVYPGPFSVKLSKEKSNIVEPDISVICDRNKLTPRGCEGAPDWIIEVVSPSDPGHDYVKKLNLYNDAGVREYWIVDPQTKLIHVYRLEDSLFGVTVFSFRDHIPVGVFENLTVAFSIIDDLLNTSF